MSHALFTSAFHAFALGALAYVLYVVRPWPAAAGVGRAATGLGLVCQGAALVLLLREQGGLLTGLSQGMAAVTFLLLCIYLTIDLVQGVPVMGAFLLPMALLVWAPGLFLGDAAAVSVAVRRPLLPFHVLIALAGVAAFAAAAGVGLVYLVMERQVKAKRFGLLFARLPSLETLDGLNRRFVWGGFAALTLTLLTGAFFSSPSGPFWAWEAKELGTVAAWLTFGVLLCARSLSGFRGRRAALWTLAGFGMVLVALGGVR
jgi:ABC-type uncharacterized transport system permease subunit